MCTPAAPTLIKDRTKVGRANAHNPSGPGSPNLRFFRLSVLDFLSLLEITNVVNWESRLRSIESMSSKNQLSDGVFTTQKREGS